MKAHVCVRKGKVRQGLPTGSRSECRKSGGGSVRERAGRPVSFRLPGKYHFELKAVDTVLIWTEG